MKQEKLVAVLIAGCLILGGAALVVRGSQDRRAPVIKVKKADLTYQEGQGYGELLKGVSAEDNRDGDLTDEVFVDRVVQIKDGKAIVYYGVMDKAKNVGTAKRTVNYVENGNAQTDAHPNTENIADENTEQSGEAAASQNEPAKADANNDLTPVGEAPVIALTTDQVTIAAGTEFDLMSEVKGVADGSDDADSLSTRISVDGQYDVNTPGSYLLHYYVIDSDGNTSEVKTLTLNVQ